MHPAPARLAVRASLVLAAATLLLAPIASAQLQASQLGTFGTQVKVGDVDYLPLTKRASAAVRVLEADFGMPGDVNDNCILLLQDNTDSGPARAAAIVAPPPAAQTPRTDVYTKDIRLTPCQGKSVGTAITDTDVVEQTTPYVQRAAEVRYADVSLDGKFGRGDNVYLTTLTGANRGLAATTGTGSWTLRLTPVGDKAAGTFVFPGDADFVSYKAVATGATPAGPGTAARSFSVTEREGNGWYIIPAGAGFAAQQAIPVNAVRIGIAGVSSQQPAITVSTLQLPSETPAGGETLKLTVKYSNDGTGSGVGLLVTRLGGTIVDARMTPVMGPGEVGQAVIPVPLPLAGGEVLLQVGDSKVTLDVEPASGGETPSAAAALEARVAQLEQQLAQQEAAPASAKVKRQGAPGASGLASLAVLGLALVVMRRFS